MSVKQAQAFDADDFEGYDGNPPASSWWYTKTVTNPDVNIPEWAEWFGKDWDYDKMVKDVRDSRDTSRERGDDEPPAIVTSLDCQNAVSMGQRSPQLEILRQAASKLCASWMQGTYSPHASARDEDKNIIVVAFELKFVSRKEGEEYKGRRSKSQTPEQLAEVERRWQNGEEFHAHIFVASQNTKIKLSSLKSFLPHSHVNGRRYKHPELGYKYTKKVPADSDFVTSGFDEPYDTMKNGETIHHPLTHILHYEQGTFPERLKDGDDKLTATQEAVNLWKEQGLKRHEIVLQDPARFGSQQVLRTLDNAMEADAYARRIGQFDPEREWKPRQAGWIYGESTAGKSYAARRIFEERYGWNEETFMDNVCVFDRWGKHDSYAEAYGYQPSVIYDNVPVGRDVSSSVADDITTLVTRPTTLTGEAEKGVPGKHFSARYHDRPCCVHGEFAFVFTCVASVVEWARRLPANHAARMAFGRADGFEPPLDADALPEFDAMADDPIMQYVNRMGFIARPFITDWDIYDKDYTDSKCHGIVMVSGWEGIQEFIADPLVLEKKAREEGMVTKAEWKAARAKYRSSMLVPAAPSSSAPETASEAPDPEPSAPEGDSGVPSVPDPAPDSSAPTEDSEPPAVSPLPSHPTADDLDRCADELLAVYDWCEKLGFADDALCDALYIRSGCSLFGQLWKAGKRYALVPGALRGGGIGGVKVGEDSEGRPVMSKPEPPYYVLHLADPYKYGDTTELNGRKVWCIDVQDVRRTAYHMRDTAVEMRKED